VVGVLDGKTVSGRSGRLGVPARGGGDDLDGGMEGGARFSGIGGLWVVLYG
jgi:hypothetical protein